MNRASKTLRHFTAILALMACTWWTPAQAQPERMKIGDLTAQQRERLLFPPREDLAAGRVLAEQSCADCHGLDGSGMQPTVPQLAGQHAVYMFLRLNDFQRGVRLHEAMQETVAFVDPDGMLQVAAYYANLQPAPPNPEAAEDINDPNPLVEGAELTATCAGCHGKDGNSTARGMPSLTGFHPKYLVDASIAYREGTRKHPLMESALASWSDEQIGQMALYYALHEPAPGDGEPLPEPESAEACKGCHGQQGIAPDPAVPSLAGMDERYFIKATQAYAKGDRQHDRMASLAEELERDDLKELAEYYASLPAEQPDVRLPLTTEQWASRCDRCHGDNGNSTQPAIPVLAAQARGYMEKALNRYQETERTSSAMHAMALALDQRAIENLAAHYASKTRRFVLWAQAPCEEE